MDHLAAPRRVAGKTSGVDDAAAAAVTDMALSLIRYQARCSLSSHAGL